MVSLQEFPAEILGVLSEFIQGNDILHLWICGSRLLNWKLASPHGARSFRYKIRSRLEAKWPLLIGQLTGLQHVSVEVKNNALKVIFSEAELKTVPNTATSLKIGFENDLGLFTTLFTAEPSRYDHLKRLSIEGNAAIASARHKLVVMLPPGLEELNLPLPSDLDDLFSDPYDPRLPLEHLPRQLTKLTLNINSFDSLLGSSLPSTLTFLEARLVQSTIDWFAVLPSALTYCHVNLMNRSEQCSHSDWRLLPRGLTSLGMVIHPLKVKASNLMALPPHLTSLSIDTTELDSELMPLLPRSLTEIGGDFAPQITRANAPFLPPNLTRLMTADSSAVDLLPHSLTHLSMMASASTGKISPEAICVPRSVLHLSSPILSSFEGLPPRLTGLSLNAQILDAHFIACLPATLQYLLCKAPSSENCLVQTPGLPESLTRLLFRSTTPLLVTAASAERLPKSLTDLDIGLIQPSSDWFPALVTSKLKSLCFQMWAGPEDSNLSTRNLSNLHTACPALKILTVHLPTDALTNALFQHLPPSLKHFRCFQGNSKVTSKSVRGGKTNKSNLTSRPAQAPLSLLQIAPHLPPNLKLLRMPPADADASCLQLLPPTLSVLTFAFSTPEWFRWPVIGGQKVVPIQ